jgi:hypothetical protein
MLRTDRPLLQQGNVYFSSNADEDMLIPIMETCSQPRQLRVGIMLQVFWHIRHHSGQSYFKEGLTGRTRTLRYYHLSVSLHWRGNTNTRRNGAPDRRWELENRCSIRFELMRPAVRSGGLKFRAPFSMIEISPTRRPVIASQVSPSAPSFPVAHILAAGQNLAGNGYGQVDRIFP